MKKATKEFLKFSCDTLMDLFIILGCLMIGGWIFYILVEWTIKIR